MYVVLYIHHSAHPTCCQAPRISVIGIDWGQDGRKSTAANKHPEDPIWYYRCLNQLDGSACDIVARLMSYKFCLQNRLVAQLHARRQARNLGILSFCSGHVRFPAIAPQFTTHSFDNFCMHLEGRRPRFIIPPVGGF